MKTLIAVTGSILFICILITSAVLPSSSGAEIQKDTPVPSEMSAEVQQSSEPSVVTEYTMKEYDNRIAVFENGNEEPIYISNTCVSDLPQADITQLRKGITVSDEKQLKRLIEDYCS